MWMPLNIWVALSEHRFNVAAVSSVVHPLGDGNVVRRHRSQYLSASALLLFMARGSKEVDTS